MPMASKIFINLENHDNNNTKVPVPGKIIGTF